MNLPIRLSQLGITRDNIDYIVEEGFTKDRMEFNPRKVTKNDLIEIIENIL